MGNTRRGVVVLDRDQQRFVSAYLAGAGSVDGAAERANLATSTCQKWMKQGHIVRATVERHIAAKERLFAALVELVEHPKASPATKLEAYRECMRLMGEKTDRPVRSHLLEESADLSKLYAMLGRAGNGLGASQGVPGDSTEDSSSEDTDPSPERS